MGTEHAHRIVYSDTLDLQSHTSPSAKDHSRQPNHPSPYGYGPAAPHQAQTLRHAENEAYQEQHTSPRASEDKLNGRFESDQHFYDDLDDDREDDHPNPQNTTNGGYNGQDPDQGDGGDSQDEDMDDDLMDKISSSPSIEDGKYPLPLWPPRVDSVDHEASPASVSTPTRGEPFSSSSPFSSTPEYFPLHPSHLFQPASHHGEYTHVKDRARSGQSFDCRQSEVWEGSLSMLPHDFTPQQAHIPLSESQEFRRYLLPLDDPLLADAVEDYGDDFLYDEDDDWEDEEAYLPEADSSSEDDTDDFQFASDNRFIDSGWGGECLREIEDIDFEFVYALHTFVATVEGQANATKGDTMVLLDDSNSYWWLVRVVKDGSIGYLPAEHIETPTERLARLNKHRNVDLSASMLGDNPEKSKNPLKKAMRRRNAKTVQFAPPTYYEPSDYEYSDEEEEGDDARQDPMGVDTSEEGDNGEDQQEASVSSAEPQEAQNTTAANSIQRIASNDSLRNDSVSSPVKTQQPGSEQRQVEEPVQRSRKGVVRNTDSFFKDDTVETKKISLTPRLLRGDSDSGGSAEQEVRQRPSLETFDKIVGTDDKTKEKKKEKKGMLSGLFKRKKGSTPEETEKLAEDARQSPGSKDSAESLSMKPEAVVERKPSKLQKTPPVTSPKQSPTEARHPQQSLGPMLAPPTGPAPEPPTARRVEPESQQAEAPQPSQPTQVNRFPSLTEKRSIFSPITTALKSTPSAGSESNSPVKPIYSKRAKERFAIDESDSDSDDRTLKVADQDRKSVSPIADYQASTQRSDSAVQISPVQASAPGRFGDSVTQTQAPAALSSSPLPHETQPPESEGTVSTSKPSPSTATHTPSTSRSTPTWSDASLRSYMENSQDIKDLLIIVHDKSNVTPVGPEHPLMQNLFLDERTKLASMQSQLDVMLMSWISKKNSNLMPTTT
ncbi:protein phosphatase regulator [Cladophialophora chaetospira]|uniref:Protein phosphatase regulator n=1 Tax=Cladophialophora chaetospira TaxID=386627 RepID=A0AA38WXI5_9EURO|nr:protein phosphatase regulator [Cladophialophora chaetospira]